MKGKNFLKKVKFLLLIIGVSLFISCLSCPEPVKVVYTRPLVPVIPLLTWIDIPGYYGLDEATMDFDDLQYFFDQYDGYVEKVDNLLKLYEEDTLD